MFGVEGRDVDGDEEEEDKDLNMFPTLQPAVSFSFCNRSFSLSCSSKASFSAFTRCSSSSLSELSSSESIKTNFEFFLTPLPNVLPLIA